MRSDLEKEELEELKSRLFTEFSDYTEVNGGKNYRFNHLETTHKIVCKLVETVDVDVDRRVLEIAALFHDIGRSEDIEDGELNPLTSHEGHEERGAKIVGEYVSDFVTEEELEKIKKIILNHHSEAETIEGKIVQDADKVSNFGVSNLWRQFHYSANNKRTINESINYFWNTAVQDFQKQIENFYFEKTVRVAEKRLEKHQKALKQIEKEINAEDFQS